MELMLLNCEVSEVYEWIIFITGDLENAIAVNTIIHLPKREIYSAMKREQKPHTLDVENDVKNFYFQ